VREDAARAYWAVVVGGGGLAMGILERLAALDFGLCICVRR
jgi:hypothetical protein